MIFWDNHCYGQDFVTKSGTSQWKFESKSLFSVGGSWFVHNVDLDESFISPEVKIGLSGSLMKKRWSVRSSLITGLKIKKATESGPFDPTDPDKSIFVSLVNSSLSKSRPLIELTGSVEYSVTEVLSLRTGAAYRYFFTNGNNSSGDFMDGFSDIGLIGSATFRLSDRLCLSMDYFHGLIKQNVAFVVNNGSSITIEERYLQITLERSINFKK